MRVEGICSDPDWVFPRAPLTVLLEPQSQEPGQDLAVIRSLAVPAGPGLASPSSPATNAREDGTATSMIHLPHAPPFCVCVCVHMCMYT